ncbi:hypothetical protein BCR35DRAFT_303000 [Leucosporidium creatinivorum]|uniref:REJ domain-containing protein n=1 Tax=Leucosporidium creatinivorum TaxID=106004 RepID=A0A1Y2FL18_9BASI|nr:hypothetical protein BCR35DRAFT_303000 [Leucosporidium creatinivorum]
MPAHYTPGPQGFALRRRQDSAAAGGDATTTGGDTAATTAADTTSAAADTTEAATTTDAATTTQTTTTEAATTTDAQTTSESDPAQTTSAAQTTSDPAATTTSAASSTTDPAASTTTTDPLATSAPTSSSSSSSFSSASTSGSSSGTSSGSSSSSAASSTVVFSTYTSLFTNTDGSVSTHTGVTSSASALPSSGSSNSGSSSSTGKTWGIVGGVVGGVAVLGAIIFIVYRLSQRRFSNLDDDAEDIKWPELQPDGQEISASTSTLNPLGTRRTGGAGVEMGDGSEFGDEMSHAGMGGGAMSMHARQPSYEQLAMADYSHQAGPQGVYDPYLGASAAPYPPPANIYPPQQYHYAGDMSGGYHDQSQEALSHYNNSTPEGYPGAAGAAAGGSPPLDQFRESDQRRGSIASSSGFHSTQDSYSAYGMSQDPFNASSSRVGSPRIASPPPSIASPEFGGDPLRRGGTPTQGPL